MCPPCLTGIGCLAIRSHLVSTSESVAARDAKRMRSADWEAHNSRVDAPSHLWTTINPQFTIVKARELYGGAPRPLSGAPRCDMAPAEQTSDASALSITRCRSA